MCVTDGINVNGSTSRANDSPIPITIKAAVEAAVRK